MSRRLGGLLLCLLPMLAAAQDGNVELAWKTGQGNELLHLSTTQVLAREPLPAGLDTPLGSIWKLFVYAWLVDTGASESAYACRGQDKEEVYCCTAGTSISRDDALVRSCSLYFAPQRLHLQAGTWRDYWQARQAPAWLSNLDTLKPQTRVPVAELLQALASLPAQQQAQRVLLDVVVKAGDGEVVGNLGGRLRVKTWSWLGDHDAQSRQGGFAGWLADGTPLWGRGPGTSQMVLKHYGAALSELLPATWPKDAGRCVEVSLFSRYPLQSLVQADGHDARPGALRGHYQVHFVNGNQLDVESAGELFLQQDAGQPKLVARLDVEEYVARVLQREASPEPAEAAKALAVAIRTYLLQNAGRSGDCLSIDDSSTQQRVAPRPASAQARTIAAWTRDLVLAGANVTYHSDQAGPNKLSWRDAVEQANAGSRYDLILLRAYPRASLSRWDNPIASCQPLTEGQDWLVAQQPRWRERLNNEVGYDELHSFAVCRLAYGRPYMDRERQRIYVRGVLSLQDRLDLTHEYLHLAFEAHPNGQDEHYIEGLARHLLLD